MVSGAGVINCVVQVWVRTLFVAHLLRRRLSMVLGSQNMTPSTLDETEQFVVHVHCLYYRALETHFSWNTADEILVRLRAQ
jgi:hypothetical protein